MTILAMVIGGTASERLPSSKNVLQIRMALHA